MDNDSTIEETKDAAATSSDNKEETTSTETTATETATAVSDGESEKVSVENQEAQSTATATDTTTATTTATVIEMDPDKINELCNSWYNKISGLDLNPTAIISSFSELTEFGIATTYVRSLGYAINKVLSTASSIKETIIGASTAQSEIDTNFSNDSGWRSSGGGSGSSYSDSNNAADTTVDSTVNNSEANLNLDSSKITSALNNLSFEDATIFNQLLSSISKDKNKSLYEILSSKEYAEDLKKALLASPNISAELKEILTSSSSEAVQQALFSIYSGDSASPTFFDSSSIDLLYKYLETEAASKGITVKELLSNSSYKSTLNGYLSSFGDISSYVKNVTTSNVNSKLTQLYDGNGIDNVSKAVVDTFRNLIDNTSASKNTTSEALLTDTANSSLLMDLCNKIGKSASYASLISSTSTDSAQTILNSVLKSKVN